MADAAPSMFAGHDVSCPYDCNGKGANRVRKPSPREGGVSYIHRPAPLAGSSDPLNTKDSGGQARYARLPGRNRRDAKGRPYEGKSRSLTPARNAAGFGMTNKLPTRTNVRARGGWSAGSQVCLPGTAMLCPYDCKDKAPIGRLAFPDGERPAPRNSFIGSGGGAVSGS